jgi:Uma2 family endonuclease
MSPDAAWYDTERWQRAETPDTMFPVVAHDFVIEIRSRWTKIRPLREKMETYIANGVQLGWLVDRFDPKVTIYRPSREPEILDNSSAVSGEGPVEGFVLDLSRVFN